MHRQVHGHGLPAAVAAMAGASVCERSCTAPGVSWLFSLFQAHGDPGSCGLFDQLSHGDAVATHVLPALPVVAPLAVITCFQAGTLARWAAPFDARGPPPPL